MLSNDIQSNKTILKEKKRPLFFFTDSTVLTFLECLIIHIMQCTTFSSLTHFT